LSEGVSELLVYKTVYFVLNNRYFAKTLLPKNYAQGYTFNAN